MNRCNWGDLVRETERNTMSVAAFVAGQDCLGVELGGTIRAYKGTTHSRVGINA